MSSTNRIKEQVSELILLSENLLNEDEPKSLEILKIEVKLRRKNGSLTRLLEQFRSSTAENDDNYANNCEELSSIISKAEDILDDLRVQLDHNERMTKHKEEQEREKEKEIEERKLQVTKFQIREEEETKRLQITCSEETKRVQIEEETKRMQEQLRKDLDTERLTLEKRVNESNQSNFTSSVASAKLPKLQLPKFNGTLLKWQEFWDSFSAAVHDNPVVKPVDKLNYLKCSLEGKAMHALEGLQMTNNNYDVAVKLLQERFGDKGRVIQAHYAALNEIPTARNDLAQLQYTSDKIEKSIRSLEALGENVDNNMLLCIIKTKLPEEILFKLEEHKKPDEGWTVSLLRKTLQWLMTAKNSANQDCGEKTVNKRNQFKPQVPHQYSTTEALFVGAERKAAKTCIFCNANHWNDQCQKFQTIQARKDKLKGRCFICLTKDHRSKDCMSQKKCFYCKKERVHHSSLCPEKFPIGPTYHRKNASSHGELVQVAQETSEEVPSQEGSLLAYGEKVFMQTAKTLIQNPQMPSHKMELRLLMDCGSHRSYISSSLASRLQLKLGKKEKLSVLTFGSSSPTIIDTHMVSLQIQLKNGSFFTIKAHVVPNVAGIMERIPMDVQKFKDVLNKYTLADDIPPEMESTPIELLIGNDYYGDFILPKKVFLASGLYLLNSKLGWILSGRIKQKKDTTNETGLLCIESVNRLRHSNEMLFATDDPQLSSFPNLDEFWKLETLGIKDSIDNDDDEQAMKNFNDSVMYENGRYHVTWPWKEENPNLPDNYSLCMGRFKSTLNRLQGDQDLLQKYDEIIQDQVRKGIIEKVTSEEEGNSKKHYIPHHPVITPAKTTTKVRIVYDASAKAKKSNKSLNECLYRGPVMLQNLCGLLMRFRLDPIAIIADIEKAFLQVGIQKKDRDVTRFLWLKDSSRCEVEDNVEIYRFCRIPFGIISSPSLLASTIRHHLSNFKTPTARKLQENIYVDNVFFGARSVEEAINTYKECKDLFNQASMNLREWTSNSKEFSSSLPKDDKAKGNEIKVLGIKWDLETDSLSIPGPNKETMISAKTKRQILKMVASIYDPLGYFSPGTLAARLFLQSLWVENGGWDDKLSDKQLREWEQIVRNLYPISMITQDRFIGFDGPDSSTYQVICFSDASALAFAAAVYLRVSNGKNVKTKLIFSKCRLTSKKKGKLSIPRLELLAVLIGCRALQFVKAQLSVPLNDLTLYSDSQCVLHWIVSQKQLSTFVSNRLKEIKESEVSFKYINTKENPADIASRGKSAIELQDCSLWQHGPDWLLKPEEMWPKWETPKINENLQTLIKSEEKTSILYEISLSVGEDFQEEQVIQETRYSSFSKLIRITAWVFRFIKKMRKQSNNTESLLPNEIQSAQKYWLLRIQKKHYEKIIISLQRDSMTDKDNLINQLGLWIDDQGLIRCHGRLQYAPITSEAIYPILLPRKEYFTDLLIFSYHKTSFHAGVAQTLATIRHEFWIPKGRSQVRRVINECQTCRRWEGGPFKMPKMPPIPKMRLSPSAPFTNVGIDYFGPLYIKDNQKVWICLYTCLVVRAIHLELLPDLSSDQFLLGFRRMLAKYGKPTTIISDNAKQFKLAKSTIDKLWSKATTNADVQSYIANEGIDWKFIVKLSPWMGGCYERMIGLVKRSLRKSIGKSCLTWDQLSTIICEVQAVINSRPLIYVGDDINSKEILTPSHFLSLNPKTGIPQVERNNEDNDTDIFKKLSSTENLLQTWKRGHNRLEQFWNMWKNNYLLSLRERFQSHLKHPKIQSQTNPSIGEVVLIKENLPRGCWKMAKIVKLCESRGGGLRSAHLVLPSQKTLHRPLSLLCPLEVSGGGP